MFPQYKAKDNCRSTIVGLSKKLSSSPAPKIPTHTHREKRSYFIVSFVGILKVCLLEAEGEAKTRAAAVISPIWPKWGRKCNTKETRN
jgi:hypothetical protein